MEVKLTRTHSFYARLRALTDKMPQVRINHKHAGRASAAELKWHVVQKLRRNPANTVETENNESVYKDVWGHFYTIAASPNELLP